MINRARLGLCSATFWGELYVNRIKARSLATGSRTQNSVLLVYSAVVDSQGLVKEPRPN